MIYILRVLMEKVQIGNVSKKIETLRKNQKEMLEIKNTLIEIKNAFDGLISGMDIAK